MRSTTLGRAQLLLLNLERRYFSSTINSFKTCVKMQGSLTKTCALFIQKDIVYKFWRQREELYWLKDNGWI